MTTREEFEKWFPVSSRLTRGRCFKLDADDGSYWLSETNSAWQAWQFQQTKIDALEAEVEKLNNQIMRMCQGWGESVNELCKDKEISQTEDISHLSEDELSKEIQSICAKAQRDAMIKIEPYNKALYEIEARKTPAQKYKEMMEIHRLTQEIKS